MLAPFVDLLKKKKMNNFLEIVLQRLQEELTMLFYYWFCFGPLFN